MNDTRCARRADVITLDQTFRVCRGVYVAVTGDVSVVLEGAGGAAVLFKEVMGGVEHPWHAVRINSSGTAGAAGDYLALY